MKKIILLFCLFSLVGTSSPSGWKKRRLLVEPEIIEKYTPDQIRQALGFAYLLKSPLNVTAFFHHVTPEQLLTKISNDEDKESLTNIEYIKKELKITRDAWPTAIPKLVKYNARTEANLALALTIARQTLQREGFKESDVMFSPSPNYSNSLRFWSSKKDSELPSILELYPPQMVKKLMSHPDIIYSPWAESLPPYPDLAAKATPVQLEHFILHPFGYADQNARIFCQGLTQAHFDALTSIHTFANKGFSWVTVGELLTQKYDPSRARSPLKPFYDRMLELKK